MAKVDVADAYMQCALHPADYRLAGIYWDKHYYFFTRLPFGSRSSPRQFARLANAVRRAMRGAFDSHVDNYLDDYILCNECSVSLHGEWQRLHDILDSVGLSAKPSKSTPPGTTIVFLGIEIDTVRMTVSLPANKLAAICGIVSQMVHLDIVSTRELRSLVGKLIWVGRVQPLCRPFIRPFIDALPHDWGNTSDIQLHLHTPLLQWWRQYLSHWRGRRVFMSHEPTKVPTIAVDAAGTGGIGAVCLDMHLREEYPPYMVGRHNNEQELYAVVRSFLHWSPLLRGKVVVLLSDNSAAVGACNKMMSPIPQLNRLLMEFSLASAEHDISEVVRHIPGVRNVAADALSPRCPLPEYFLHAVHEHLDFLAVFDHV